MFKVSQACQPKSDGVGGGGGAGWDETQVVVVVPVAFFRNKSFALEVGGLDFSVMGRRPAGVIEEGVEFG